MDTKIRAAADDLMLKDLSLRAKRFSFFQINKLFKRCLTLSQENSITRIRFAAKKSLAFPSSDIDSIVIEDTLDGQEMVVYVTFMGLFGPSSPLPSFYTERILHADDDDTAAAFLNLFNHHVISLLQRTWEKYRYYIQFENNAGDQMSRWFLMLSGLDHVNWDTSELTWQRILPVMNLLSIKVKNAATLRALLESYFETIKFEIEECIERVVDIPLDQCHRMGECAMLMGEDIVLGDEIVDRMGKFRIHVLGLSSAEYQSFLPNQTNYNVLQSIVRHYLRDQLDMDICLHLDDLDYLEGGLGDENKALGWNVCMGKPKDNVNHALIVV